MARKTGWQGPRGTCPVCGSKDVPLIYSARRPGLILGAHPAQNPPPLTDDPASQSAQVCEGRGRPAQEV
jgi:hypothetical protein